MNLLKLHLSSKLCMSSYSLPNFTYKAFGVVSYVIAPQDTKSIIGDRPTPVVALIKWLSARTLECREPEIGNTCLKATFN